MYTPYLTQNVACSDYSFGGLFLNFLVLRTWILESMSQWLASSVIVGKLYNLFSFSFFIYKIKTKKLPFNVAGKIKSDVIGKTLGLF